MGLHGGINILHQKKWHVYNADNRAKVQRDEENYEREQRAAELKEKRTITRAKLNELHSRHYITPRESSTTYDDDTKILEAKGDHTDEYESLLKKKLRGQISTVHGLEDVHGSSYADHRYGGSKHQDNTKKRKSRKDQEDIDNTAPSNINFFKDIEEDEAMRIRKHEQYLSDIGHSSQDKCNFLESQNDVKNAWYLKDSDTRRAIVPFTRRGRKPLVDQSDLIKTHTSNRITNEEAARLANDTLRSVEEKKRRSYKHRAQLISEKKFTSTVGRMKLSGFSCISESSKSKRDESEWPSLLPRDEEDRPRRSRLPTQSYKRVSPPREGYRGFKPLSRRGYLDSDDG